MIVKWTLKVQNPGHNHTADDNLISHPTTRTLIEEQSQQILNLSEASSKPRDILALIQKEHTLVSPRDIYNAGVLYDGKSLVITLLLNIC